MNGRAALGGVTAFFAAFYLTSAMLGQSTTDLVIGDRDLSPNDLIRLGSRFGKTGRVEPDGFLPVRVCGTYESVERALRSQGIDYVFKPSARDVNPSSIESVRGYIAYTLAVRDLSGSDSDEEKGVEFYDALLYYLERRVEPDGYLDPERWLRGADHREQMPKWRPRGKSALDPTGAWQQIGPLNLGAPYQTYYGIPPLSGRKSSVAYAPSDPSIIYAVGATGGVFRSGDSGITWVPKSDSWRTLACNSIAVDPLDPNTIYAGTGDLLRSATAFGLMKSTDGGNTWTNYASSQFSGGVVSRLIIDPANRNVLLATLAYGGRGIWRSADAGVTWTQVLAPNKSMIDIDVSIDDGGGRTWWAVGGPNTIGGAIFKSADGVNWVAVTSPSPVTENAMEIACSKVDRNTVYLLATGAEQIYKSTDAGSSWVSIKNNFPNDRAPGDNYNWLQKTYNYHISTTGIGGTDVVLVGLVNLAASFDAGTTWKDIGLTLTGSAKTHNDQHCFANHPSDPATVLIGNDGGIYRTVLNPGNGTASFTPLNSQITDHLLYHVSLHPTNSARIMAGAQDNATAASRGNLSSWAGIYVGDGGWSAFDQNNPATHFTTSQNLGVYLYTSDDDPLGDVITGNWGSNASFIAPLIIAGNGSELFGATSNNLQKWTGAGRIWVQSSQDIAGTGKVTYLASSHSNGSVIYSGASNGQVWRTADEGQSFVQIDGGLPDLGIGAIAVSNSNPDEVFVAEGNNGALYHCLDTLAIPPVWTKISGSGLTALPNVPVNAIAIDPTDPETLYVGTDVGAFISTDSGLTWSNMNAAGLPNVEVSDLRVNNAGTYLYAATYGRGLWRVPLASTTYPVTGWVRQNGESIPGSEVRLMLGPTVVGTAVPDSNGNFALNFPAGNYTLVPFHQDKVFFPASRAITLPPTATAQNFTGGNIGPVSITWQYQPVVYSDQSRQGTLSLNVETPVARAITMSDNSFKLTSPVTVTVPAGQRTATFFVYGVAVLVDTPASVTATHQGLTAVATITVRPKPSLISMTLSKVSVRGGIGVSGSVGIDRPAIGPMGLYLTSSNTNLANITPSPTAFYNGASTKAFYCKTFPVVSTQVVTLTASFYGSSQAVNLTLTP